jgi:hypothetical protein
MRPIGEIIKHEIREIVPAAIYFLVTFNIVAFSDRLMLRQYGIGVSNFVAASIGALVMAKVILLTEMLPFMEPFPKIPIVYNVVWKTLIYWVGAIIFQLLEPAIRARSLTAALDLLPTPHFWMVQIWLVFLVLIFCGYKELIKTIGAEKAKEIFFGRVAAHEKSKPDQH